MSNREFERILAWWNVLRFEPSYQELEHHCYASMCSPDVEVGSSRLRALYERVSFGHTKHENIVPDIGRFDSFLKKECLWRPYMREFLTQFGDLMLFPISWKCSKPDPSFLHAIWTFKPAKAISVDELEVCLSLKDESALAMPLQRLQILPLMLNPALSEAAIIADVVEEVTKKIAATKREFPDAFAKGRSLHDWEPKPTFEEATAMWAEYKGTGKGYERLGLEWAWKEPSKANTSLDDANGVCSVDRVKYRARNRIKTIENEVAPFFARLSPAKSKRKVP